MGNERINILCATDANYAALCGIMLKSLFENNKDLPISVYLLTEGLPEEECVRYRMQAEEYGAEMNILKVEASMFANCPIWEGDHLSVAAYYRLMAPVLLPETIDKILYLDCDLIVDKSVRSLWNQDVSDVAVGAIRDAEFFNSEFYERLKLPKNNRYFNSGVLLMNLHYWRENRVTERCFECIEQNRAALRYHDQDTLNVVLQNETKLLPIAYNFQTPFILSVFSAEYGDFINEITDTAKSPCIIHYIGSGKPWLNDSFHPFKAHFAYYKRRSLWKNVDLARQQPFGLDEVKRRIVRFLWAVGLKKYPKIYIIESQKKK